jgi:tripartite-type tricarboxylate transporter receptor subunit TctC
LRSRRERTAAGIQAVAADPGLAERVYALGMVPRTSTAEELARVIGESHLHWAERARTYGVRPMG